MPSSLRHQGGFTLVEVVLGLAISSMLILAAMQMFIHIQRVYMKSQVMSEVEGQGIQAMQIVTQTIRDSLSVNSPTAGNSASTLSINVDNGSLDTTSFEVVNGILMMNESDATPYELTNDRIVVSGLQFANLSPNNDYTSIRVDFVLSHYNPSGRNELSYTKIFESAAGFFTE